MSEASRSGASACRKRRAVTLIEAVLFIAIALGLIVGGLVFYRQATLSRQTSEVVRLTNAVLAEIRSMVRQGNFSERMLGYDGDMGDILTAAAMVPTRYQRPNPPPISRCAFMSPWGTCTIVAGVGDPISTMSFRYYDIPVRLCSRIASFDGSGVGPLGHGITQMSAGYDPDNDGNGGSFDKTGEDWNPPAPFDAGTIPASHAGEFCRLHEVDGKTDLFIRFSVN